MSPPLTPESHSTAATLTTATTTVLQHHTHIPPPSPVRTPRKRLAVMTEELEAYARRYNDQPPTRRFADSNGFTEYFHSSGDEATCSCVLQPSNHHHHQHHHQQQQHNHHHHGLIPDQRDSRGYLPPRGGNCTPPGHARRDVTPVVVPARYGVVQHQRRDVVDVRAERFIATETVERKIKENNEIVTNNNNNGNDGKIKINNDDNNNNNNNNNDHNINSNSKDNNDNNNNNNNKEIGKPGELHPTIEENNIQRVSSLKRENCDPVDSGIRTKKANVCKEDIACQVHGILSLPGCREPR